MLDDDVEEILKRGAEKQQNSTTNSINLVLMIYKISLLMLQHEWNGQDFTKKGNNASLGLNWINPSKRVRKELTYSLIIIIKMY